MIPERPRLRHVDAQGAEVEGEQVIVLRDPFDVTDAVLVFPLAAAVVLNYCTGTRTVEDVAAAVQADHGVSIDTAQIRQLLETLDRHTFLDSPTYRDARAHLEEEFRSAPVRPASLAGRSYDAEPVALRAELDALFTQADGPGRVPTVGGGTGSLRGAIVPHIDFRRGGPTYGHGYAAIAAHADADLFVILGTGHGEVYNLYTATWKGFATPFGTLPTDTRFLDTVQRHVDLDLTADEFAHRGEHSIEFHAVLLQYLYAARRDIRIVPILCGSFHHFIQENAAPDRAPGVAGMVAGLRAAVAEARADGARVCLLASADLAHVGTKFGDADPADDAVRSRVQEADLQMLDAVVAGNADQFFAEIQAVRDERRVCGLPCIYTMLSVLDPTRGELLQYRQWPDPHDCVTFASVAFHAP